MQFTLIMSGSRIDSLGSPFVFMRLAQFVCFGIQQGIEGVFNRRADHFTQMVFELSLVNFDHITQVFARLCRIVVLHLSVLSLASVTLCHGHHRPMKGLFLLQFKMCERNPALSTAE